MTEIQVARAGAFDDIPIYALADGSRLKVWDGEEAPDPTLVNLWLDPADEILKRYDADDGWTDAGIVGEDGDEGPKGDKGDPGESIKGDKGDRGEPGKRGERGYSVLSGARDPEAADGRDGDFWINTLTARIFGPKAGGEWSDESTSLIGPRGERGPRGLSGGGPEGPRGPGVAAGGTAGQLLSKIDATDYNTEWVDALEGTGGVTDEDVAAAVAAHEAASNPHPVYLTQAEGDALYKAIGYVPSWAEITGKPTTFPPDAHNHDDRYFTETESDGRYVRTVNDVGPDVDGNVDVVGSGGPVDWSDLTFNDGRPTYEGEQLALWSDRELAADSRDEGAGLDAYPPAETTMAVSDTAGWTSQDLPAVVTTIRTGTIGRQEISVDGGGYRAYREWDESDPGWRAWTEYERKGHVHFNIEPLNLDELAEPDPVDYYSEGISILRVSAVADWNGLGLAGHVFTERNPDDTGKQTFAVPETETSYTRYYSGGAWGSWASGGGLDQATADTLYEPLDSAYTKAEADTRYVNETDHTKAAHDALDIDADTLDGIDSTGFAPIAHVGAGGTAHANAVASGAAGFQTGTDKAKLDGIESGATADQTAAEILTAVKTVDGTGSGLDADTVDGIEASAFATAARTISTTAPLTGGGDLSANRTLAVSTATEAAEGVSERATQGETDTGTDDVRYVSPAKLKNTTALDSRYYTETEADTLLAAKAPTARTISTTAPLTGGGDLSANRTLAVSQGTETAQGVLELATDAETQTGTDTARAITPANLSARSATETRTGVAEIATQTEMNTGTDDVRIVTPLKARTANDARYLQSVTQATETVVGGGEIATQAEFNTGTDDQRIVTPLKARVGNDARYVRTVNSVAPDGSGNVAVSGGSLSLTEVEVDLGSTPATSGSFQITGLSGLVTDHHVLIRQAVGPYTGKGTLADEFEMDVVNVAGKVASASSIQCYWSTDSIVRGNFKFAYAVG